MIHITVRNFIFELGYPSIMKALFNSIAHHLEGREWGSKYPVIMNELYYEGIEVEHLEQGLKEIKEIQEKLKDYAPDQIVWNYEDITISPPWGNRISDNITSLSNYFMSTDGNESIDTIIYAIELALRVKHRVCIKNINMDDVEVLDINQLMAESDNSN